MSKNRILTSEEFEELNLQKKSADLELAKDALDVLVRADRGKK